MRISEVVLKLFWKLALNFSERAANFFSNYFCQAQKKRRLAL